jgi:universal stress protein A
MQLNEYSTILIAIDVFTEYKKVLQRGLALAEDTSQIYLVNVTLPDLYFSPYGVEFPTDLATQINDQAKEKLNAVAEEFHIPNENVFVPFGSPAEEIHQIAEDIEADIIVIGTHGQSGLKLLLGSTANAVLHGVKCDVLAVRV